MKLIKAYIRTYMADKVIHALEQIGTPRFTAIDIRALSDEVDAQQPGYKGDGIIVVSPVEEVIKIRTGSRQKSQKEFGKP